MKKQTFVKAIQAIQKQMQLDIKISKHLAKAFPNAFEANLLPETRKLHPAKCPDTCPANRNE